MKNTLTVIVPVLNEEKHLEDSVNNLLLKKEFTEIFLVDDCSTDKSLEIMKKIEINNNNVTCFKSKYSTNRGKGDAITRVKDFIKTDYVVIHDADLEYDPDDIIEMMELIDFNEDTFVIGSRFLKDKKIQHYYRTHFANRFLSRLFTLFHGKKISDIASCYKLMPTTFFKETEFVEKGFAIEIELVAKFLRVSKNIKEFPIKYTARTYEDGKKIKSIDGIRYIYTIFKFRFI